MDKYTEVEGISLIAISALENKNLDQITVSDIHSEIDRLREIQYFNINTGLKAIELIKEHFNLVAEGISEKNIRPKFYTVKEAAHQLGTTPQLLRKRLRKEGIPKLSDGKYGLTPQQVDQLK